MQSSRTRLAKRIVVALMIICALMGLAVGYWFLTGGGYRSHMAQILSSPLEYIEFQPHFDREMVRIDAPDEMHLVREWLQRTQSPAIASYPPTSCSLVLHFSDGRVKRIAVSPTGLTKSNFMEITPGRFRPIGNREFPVPSRPRARLCQWYAVGAVA